MIKNLNQKKNNNKNNFQYLKLDDELENNLINI